MGTIFITLNKENIDREHICCAISDKKCSESYQAKKAWLKREFDNGYVFRRLNERAKVFIEYVPAEKAWIPVVAPNYLMINCFWVSGQYKGKGYAKALLQTAIDDALEQGKDGLVTVAGTGKFHFMSDPKWFLKQGFETVEIIKLETLEQAQSAPTPATIFSLFYNGKFVTTDISCCLDSRFDKTAPSLPPPKGEVTPSLLGRAGEGLIIRVN